MYTFDFLTRLLERKDIKHTKVADEVKLCKFYEKIP